MTEPLMTNDEYHDLLDARKAAMQDFRYVNIDSGGTRFEVEAYQINGRSRFTDDEWPNWMVKQKGPSQVNAIYCDADDPNMLVLMKADGMEQPLGDTDWLVLYKTGEITAVPEGQFLHFDKVVPVPPRPEPAEELPGFEEQWELDENNNLIPRKTPLVEDNNDNAQPLAGADLVPAAGALADDNSTTSYLEEILQLRQQMKIAMECLTGGQSKGAIKARQHLSIGLETAEHGGLKWCDCAPGSCDESTKWGCRTKSPLL